MIAANPMVTGALTARSGSEWSGGCWSRFSVWPWLWRLPGVCAIPAKAEEMRADEARHFIAGKHFAYNCFDGTNGNGRIYADGSVAGYVQPGGNGPRRYVVLPTGTLRTSGDRYLRLGARPSVRALLQSRPHQPGELPRLDLGPWLRLLQFRPARLARGFAAAPTYRLRGVRASAGGED